MPAVIIAVPPTESMEPGAAVGEQELPVFLHLDIKQVVTVALGCNPTSPAPRLTTVAAAARITTAKGVWAAEATVLAVIT